MAKTEKELLTDLLKRVANLVSRDSIQDTLNALIVVPAQLVEDLRKSLKSYTDYISDLSELTETPEGALDKVDVPKNVAVTLQQYHLWGVDLWDFDKVREKCFEYGDVDVLNFIVKYRKDYKELIAMVIK